MSTNKFVKVKFVRKHNAENGDYVVEGQAWNEQTSVNAMANPDYRELGEGKTLSEAKTAAAAALQEAHKNWMLNY